MGLHVYLQGKKLSLRRVKGYLSMYRQSKPKGATFANFAVNAYFAAMPLDDL